jgi:hypothetical protein
MPSNQIINSSEALSASSGGVLEYLMNMYVYLSEHGSTLSATVGLVVEQGHALLNAERLEDRF